MSEQIVMPKLGMTMEEGNIQEWYKQVGDPVDKGESVVMIASEKLTQDVEAPATGVLTEIKVEPNEDAKVGEVLGVIEDGGEEVQDETVSMEESFTSSAKISEVSDSLVSTNDEESKHPVVETENHQTEAKQTERIFISPLARRLAKDNQLDIQAIKGTGGNRRITKLDIERVLNKGYDFPASTTEKTAIQSTATQSSSIGEGLKPMRKAIARNMRNSLDQTAQLTLHRKANADKLIEFQKRLRAEIETGELDIKLSLTVLIARATVLALQDYQKMNARYENGQLTEFVEVHLGIATSLEDGLVVPVVKNAHQKSVGRLAEAISDVATKARNGEMNSDLYSGSTFTITNMGASEIEYFTPIINAPESGILGVGSLQDELQLTEAGQVKAAKKIPFSLTFDHQILDGADAAEFLKILVKYIESPYLLVL